MVDLLADQLKLMAASVPDAIAFRELDAGGQLTFAVWDGRSNQLGRGLRDAGIGKGDRVAIYLPPPEAIDWVVSYAGVHRAGAVAVPTNTRLAAPELRGVLGHAEVSAVITSPQLAGVIAGVAGDVPSLQLVVTTDVDAAAQPAAAGPARWCGLAELMTASPAPFQVPVDGDDIADIMYTSGTTGRPKGVVVRHGNAALIPNGVPTWSGAGWLSSSPLFTFAGVSSIYNPMKLGMTALYQPRFDAGRWLKVVESERPIAVFLVPSMAKLLLAHPDFEGADLSSVLLCTVGGSPLAPEVQRRLQQKMPDAAVSNGYGMTEAGTAYSILPKEEAERRIGSVGKPMPPVEFSIVDDDGAVLGAREVGELVIRMPGRPREYYRDPEATAGTWLADGLHTGDLAYLDEDGYLYIVGRKKEVIIRGGNNVYAVDIETVLAEHPDVLDAAVAGVAHPVLGEDVAAWVVLKPGASADAEALRVFLAGRLADYKVPRQITIVEDLPRNATGKVVKRLLTAEHGDRGFAS